MVHKMRIKEIQPETIEFRKHLLVILKKKDMSAYDIATQMTPTSMKTTKEEWLSLYNKVVRNCRKLVEIGCIKKVGTEISSAPIDKVIYSFVKNL